MLSGCFSARWLRIELSVWLSPLSDSRTLMMVVECSFFTAFRPRCLVRDRDRSRFSEERSRDGVTDRSLQACATFTFPRIWSFRTASSRIWVSREKNDLRASSSHPSGLGELHCTLPGLRSLIMAVPMLLMSSAVTSSLLAASMSKAAELLTVLKSRTSVFLSSSPPALSL